MAVDEALLEWSERTGGCAWRFYGWAPATVSLGYFQDFADWGRHTASRDCPIVRRASGGGAIVHDRELTYSLVVPREHPLATRRLLLYQTIHRCLIETLGAKGIEARLCEETEQPGRGAQPFLCFERRAAGDVLVGPVKVAGSAQRRNRGAVLQHGSLLLARSPAAPELNGLAELAGHPVHHGDLVQNWLDRLAERMGLAWREQPLAKAERERAGVLMRTKYGSDHWTRDRGRGGSSRVAAE